MFFSAYDHHNSQLAENGGSLLALAIHNRNNLMNGGKCEEKTVN